MSSRTTFIARNITRTDAPVSPWPAPIWGGGMDGYQDTDNVLRMVDHDVEVEPPTARRRFWFWPRPTDDSAA